MIVCAVTLLPEPDSPTIASTSPGRRSKLTPSTACSRPPSVAKPTRRSLTERSGAALTAPTLPESHPRVEVGVGDVDQGVDEDDEEGAVEGRRP